MSGAADALQGTAPAAPAADPRSRLAAAISRHRDAEARVERLQQAQPEALDQQIQARKGLDAAQERLNATEATDSELVEAFLAPANGNRNPLAAAELRFAVEEASTIYAASRRVTEALDRELDQALAGLRWERQRVAEAVAAVVLASPELQALLTRLGRLRSEARSIEEALRTLDSHSALPRAVSVSLPPTNGFDHDIDPALRDQWSATLEALTHDPLAPLPKLEPV